MCCCFFIDIDDIEDFELDDGGLVEDLLHDDLADDQDDDLLLEDGRDGGLVAAASRGAPALRMHAPIERERKRGSFLMMASPDLAYGSLNPSTGNL